MPITKSAVKAMRQNIRHRRRNIQLKATVKSEVKALTAAIAEGNAKLVAERMASAQSKIDKAAKAGIIHKNKAARQKSQLVKAIKSGGSPADSKAAAKAKPTSSAQSAEASAKAEKPTEDKPTREKPEKPAEK